MSSVSSLHRLPVSVSCCRSTHADLRLILCILPVSFPRHRGLDLTAYVQGTEGEQYIYDLHAVSVCVKAGFCPSLSVPLYIFVRKVAPVDYCAGGVVWLCFSRSLVTLLACSLHSCCRGRV